MPTLVPVQAQDFDDMVALRIAALRQSLERLGLPKRMVEEK